MALRQSAFEVAADVAPSVTTCDAAVSRSNAAAEPRVMAPTVFFASDVLARARR